MCAAAANTVKSGEITLEGILIKGIEEWVAETAKTHTISRIAFDIDCQKKDTTKAQEEKNPVFRRDASGVIKTRAHVDLTLADGEAITEKTFKDYDFSEIHDISAFAKDALHFEMEFDAYAYGSRRIEHLSHKTWIIKNSGSVTNPKAPD